MTKHTNPLVPKPEWWKHLRWAKRIFWKKERKAGQKETLKGL
jgi:hypothetical protein